MLFLLGFITGLVSALFIICTLAFFRVGIERKVQIIERRLEQAGPQPRGYVLEPEDDAAIARQEIIDKNNREGRDTPINELL